MMKKQVVVLGLLLASCTSEGDKAAERFAILESHGGKDEELCEKARQAAAAYLQERDEQAFSEWRQVEEQHCGSSRSGRKLPAAASSVGADVQAPTPPAPASAQPGRGKSRAKPGSFSTSEQRLIDKWMRLNSECRGGSGDEDATWVACDAREEAMRQLHRAGICYGRDGEAGYQMKIHRCGPGSLR